MFSNRYRARTPAPPLLHLLCTSHYSAEHHLSLSLHLEIWITLVWMTLIWTRMRWLRHRFQMLGICPQITHLISKISIIIYLLQMILILMALVSIPIWRRLRWLRYRFHMLVLILIWRRLRWLRYRLHILGLCPRK